MICQLGMCQKEAKFVPVIMLNALNDPSCVVKIFCIGRLSCEQHQSLVTIEDFFDHQGWKKISKEFANLKKRPNLTTIRLVFESITDVMQQEDLRAKATESRKS